MAAHSLTFVYDLHEIKECKIGPRLSAFPKAVVLEAITKCLRTNIPGATGCVIKSHHILALPVLLEEHMAGLSHQGAVVLAWVQAIATSGPMLLGLLGFFRLLAFVEDGVGV